MLWLFKSKRPRRKSPRTRSCCLELMNEIEELRNTVAELEEKNEQIQKR